jgi:bis(5'-nucleosyl)-tetraphosphatase (symmetrical)
MATYAIGDVQGCYKTLSRLLVRIGFHRRDRLWFVGDLVNRGPRNREVLHLVRDLGERAVVVLGNHDLHLIARAEGISERKKRDTIEDVLEADDGDELVAWLREQPLLHRENGTVMVHAGLLPRWTIADAVVRAREVEHALRGKQRRKLLQNGGRLSKTLRAFTRLRMCDTDGRLCDHDGKPEDAPAGCIPWFEHPYRRSAGTAVVFGHWSALGLRVSNDAIALDTGCVWGGALTAVRLEDRRVFSEPAAEKR